ncbi:bacteriocin-like protein [Chryseobacterium sp. T16E-39]|uniref:bacteriocin-like protein n=1 Tax=Chryseobacterium sp. T16E-39 TaxID=2015076 RepID=UPI0026C65940
MKNSKKISRENLKSIKGGFKACNGELPNYGCGDASVFCCASQGCRRVSDLPPGSCIVQ